ncbi:60s ribosomal protein l13a [Quercus suber]|uniref:60s ribosomal protein l13a n=1 Tax=Quercus suber TaxID=58331 RepID=A0AAW0JTJ1_QUESU
MELASPSSSSSSNDVPAPKGVHVSVEPDSSDDVVMLLPPDMGQCSNRKGKLPAHPDTSTRKKRKAGSSDRATDAIVETQMSRISIESAQVPDHLSSMVKATKIVISMADSLGDETLFEELERKRKERAQVAYERKQLTKLRVKAEKIAASS